MMMPVNLCGGNPRQARGPLPQHCARDIAPRSCAPPLEPMRAAQTSGRRRARLWPLRANPRACSAAILGAISAKSRPSICGAPRTGAARVLSSNPAEHISVVCALVEPNEYAGTRARFFLSSISESDNRSVSDLSDGSTSDAVTSRTCGTRSTIRFNSLSVRETALWIESHTSSYSAAVLVSGEPTRSLKEITSASVRPKRSVTNPARSLHRTVRLADRRCTARF